MITCYHGSPTLFDKFDLSNAGDGTGIKFGFGVYLTESEASAVNYSEPRPHSGPRTQVKAKDHYLYTVEIPELTNDNHLVSAQPVPEAIVKRAEAQLGQAIPQEKTQVGKEFRKWLGLTLTNSEKVCLESEKAAAEFLDSIGVIFNVWPQAQGKPDGLKNYAVFDAKKVHILKVEHIEVELKRDKYVLVKGSKKEVKL